MYICTCHGITDDQIRDAVDAGARDVAAVSSTLGCGATCGDCVEMTRCVVEARRAECAPGLITDAGAPRGVSLTAV